MKHTNGKSPSKYKGPLAGVNVIDFGHYYAGPMAAMMLADQGANVIHIMKPGEPELREQQYRLLNRNKKRLTLDLKTLEGKNQALSLVEKADVVIENFRPGVMKRLGLDYATVKDSNPGLVYLSLPGFASTDKKRRHIQAWEGVLGAACTLYASSSWWRESLNYPPVYIAVPICSVYGGMHGMISILSALLAREKYGVGTWIEAPLAELGLSGYSIVLSGVQDWKGGAAEIPDHLKAFLYASEDTEVEHRKKHAGAMRAVMNFPFYNISYTCADGRKVHVNAVFPKFVEALLSKMGLYQEFQSRGFLTVDPFLTGRGLENNLAGNLGTENEAYVRQRMEEVFLTRTADEWESLVGEIACVSKVRTREEWLALEPMIETGVLTTMDNGISVLTVPGRVADVGGPSMDSTESLLGIRPKEGANIGWDEALQLFSQREALLPLKRSNTILKKGDLLKGIKVLDLSNVIAGPTSSYTLAQFGAEVIKLDSAGLQSYFMGIFPQQVMEIGQGKRSILIDPKTAPGGEILHKLVGWADVVVHNSLDNVAERLGISHQQLKKINSKVVTCQLSAFGGTYRGGWELRPGNDSITQCPTGMATRFGTLEAPQLMGGFAPTDMMGGLGLAITALLALYQQRKTGYAGEGRTSLARVVSYSELPFMIAENGCSDWGESHGQLAVGENWHQRIYACRDAWLYVGAREDQTLQFAALITDDEKAEEGQLESAFAQLSCEQALALLDKANIACHRVMSMRDIKAECRRTVDNGAADETADESYEVLRRSSHPSGLTVDALVPSWVRIGEDHSYKRLSIGPRLGEHTVDILKELGYGDDEIENLIRLKVAHEFLPALGSKSNYYYTSEQSK